MAYDLSTIPGNYNSDDFDSRFFGTMGEPYDAGGYMYNDLYLPGLRQFTNDAGGAAPVQSVAGVRGNALYTPAGCDEVVYASDVLGATANDDWNKIRANECKIVVHGFVGFDSIAADRTVCGVWGSSNAQRQFRVQLIAASNSLRITVKNSATTTAYAEVAGIVAGTKNFFSGQILANGITGGGELVACRMRLNSTESTTTLGTPAIIPCYPTSASFQLAGENGSTHDGIFIDQFGILMGAGTNPLNTESMDALYNNGLGILPVEEGGGFRSRDWRSRPTR